MTIKNEILAGIAATIAGSTIIGGGKMVLDAHKDIAQHELRLNETDRTQRDLSVAVDDLRKSVQSLDKGVAVLNERIDRK